MDGDSITETELVALKHNPSMNEFSSVQVRRPLSTKLTRDTTEKLAIDSSSYVVRSSVSSPFEVTLDSQKGLDDKDILKTIKTENFGKKSNHLEKVVKLSRTRTYAAIILLVSIVGISLGLLLKNYYGLGEGGIYLLLTNVLFCSSSTYELYENVKYRVKRNELVKNSPKGRKFYVAPFVCTVVFVVTCFGSYPIGKAFLAAMGLLAQCITTALTLREINSNTRFINSLLGMLYVKKPGICAGVDTFYIVPTSISTDDAMYKLAHVYKGLKFYTSSLSKKLVVMLFQLSIVVVMALVMLESDDTEFSNLNISTVGSLFYIFLVQMMSAWQVAAYNKHLEAIENYHYIDTGLSVSILGFTPKQSLVISILISALFNLVAVVKRVVAVRT